MKPHILNFIKSLGSTNTILIFLLLFDFTFCGCTFPPNLSKCDSLKIIYQSSAEEYISPKFNKLLTKEEQQYLHTFDIFTVNDKGKIKRFAEEIKGGKYYGKRELLRRRNILIECYCDETLLASLNIIASTIVATENGLFKYAKGHPDMEIIEPNGIINFKNRYECANNLTMLYNMGPFNQDIVKVPFYPEYNKWTDSCLTYIQQRYFKNDPAIYSEFACPGKFQLSNYNSSNKLCNYAMNPNCKPDSPGDMVLLFETKDGWNQHGGPELFTFDNHDPKGGCVLFNDGTIKFIRTEEELNNLRWK